MPLHELAVVVPLYFLSGLINAAVGGGGLITVPGLLGTFPTVAPAALFATDKVSSIFGHSSAMRHYASRMSLPGRLIAAACALAALGGFVGATVVTIFPPDAIRPTVLVILVVLFAYTLARPSFGLTGSSEAPSRRRLVAGLGLCAVIGLYDGFCGPGTGSFLVFVFVRVVGFDFLRATGCAKFVNCAADVGALVWFLPTGVVMWWLAVPMGVASYAGGLIGARLVMRGGNGMIRPVFVTVSGLLILKLGWDVLGGW